MEMSSDITSSSCRLCLKNGDNSIDLFDFNSVPSYSELIYEIFQFHLLDPPGWPRNGCASCISILNNLRILKSSILTSQDILLQRFSISERDDEEINSNSTSSPKGDQQLSSSKEENHSSTSILMRQETVTEDEVDGSENVYEDQDYQSEQELSELSPKSTPTVSRKSHKIIKSPSNFSLRKGRRRERKSDETTLEDVMRTMDLLNCHICQSPNDSLKDLFSHMKTAHKNPRGFIFCCDRRKFGRATALDHMRVHLDKDAFKCTICKQRYPAQWHLDYHLKQVHTDPADRQFVCDVCGKSFAKRSGFEDHVKYHTAPEDRPHKCSFCGHGFTTPYQLKRHVARLHEKTNDFVCEECGKGFTTNSLLSAHRYKNHRDRKVDPLRKGCKYIRCEVCDKRVSERNFQAHMANNCFQEGAEMKCIICNRTLKTPKSLKAHMRLIHPDRENGLECPHCPFLAVTAGNRMRHIKNAHPVEFEKLKYTIRDEVGVGEDQEEVEIVLEDI